MSTTSSIPPAANGSAENGTILHFIEQLKSAFRPVDFDEFQQILTDREEGTKREIAHWKKEYEAMEKNHGEVALEKLKVEDELYKCRRERDLLRDKVSRAEEDQRVQIARLEEDQKVRMDRFKEDQRSNFERAKSSEERYAKLWEDFTNVETENLKLGFTISSLEFEKRKAEQELEACKKRFEELNSRVSRLEEDIAVLMSGRDGGGGGDGPTTAVNLVREEVVAERLVSDEVIVGREVSSTQRSDQQDGAATVDENGDDESQSKASASNCGEEDNSLPVATDSMQAGRNPEESGSRVIIEIDDSDDEMPKRKRSLCDDDDDNDVKPNTKRQTKALPELSKDGIDFSESSDTGDSSSSGSDIDIDSEMEKLHRRLGCRKAWESRDDMVSAFGKEPKLCMNAVRALYRQESCKVESVSGSLLSRNQGFNQDDALRGVPLGKYLTDENPQGKLKRSVRELQQIDPNVLDECREFAIRYSDQLFEIYQKKEDPFFCPS